MDVLEVLLEVVLVLPALRRTGPPDAEGDDEVVVDALRNPTPLRLVANFAAVLEQCIIVSCTRILLSRVVMSFISKERNLMSVSFHFRPLIVVRLCCFATAARRTTSRRSKIRK